MNLSNLITLVILLLSFNSYGNSLIYGYEIQIEHISENNTEDSISVSISDNRLIIENLPKDNILEIFNIMGVKVYTRRLKAGTNEYQISLPRGYYIIKIGKFTKKIAIK